MPYKSEYTHFKIPRSKDGRIKLEDHERQQIRDLYGKISQRKLAKMFKVSRRLICFIGNPKQHEDNLKRRLERGGSKQYYDKDKHRMSVQKTRLKRQKLYLNKELIKGDLID